MPLGWKRAMPELARAVPLLPVLLLLATVGCQQTRFADERLAMRGDNLGQTCSAVERSEQRRPRQLARTTDRAAARVARARSAARENAAELEQVRRRRWERWNERGPDYAWHVLRILGGRPERIERNAIILFF
jgi:hypothetical protein